MEESLFGRVPTYACKYAPSQHNRAGDDDEGRDEAEKSLSLECSLLIFPLHHFPPPTRCFISLFPAAFYDVL